MILSVFLFDTTVTLVSSFRLLLHVPGLTFQRSPCSFFCFLLARNRFALAYLHVGHCRISAMVAGIHCGCPLRYAPHQARMQYTSIYGPQPCVVIHID